MRLKNKLSDDVKVALRAHNRERLIVLRYFLSIVKNYEIDHGEIGDDQIQILMKKEIKQINESISEYKKAQRDDLVIQEKQKITILEEYLPPELTDQQIREKVTAILSNIDKSNFGLVMKEVMSQLKGQASGQKISQLVKELIANL